MKFVEGDITEAPEVIIVHGCNMQGKMNSGVAKALRKKYPSIYLDYIECMNSEGIFGLGDHVTTLTKSKIIGNLLTQDRYGYDGAEYASLDAIESALKSFIIDFEDFFGSHIPAIATPKIGCGRGGLQWNDVRGILEKIEKEYNVEFVVYDIPDEFTK
ncbi:Appr-1-p processing enzyme family protein [Sinorhizobium phage phiM7]|uniref:Appr-1-p processing enzyme family n=2 Tax=Emdodecavirus TaxID=1980937 RepID=S5MD83_9CAUD|nr:Appr-1-p processing enzyme family [Sinorhizobium phage phiM12]YP_009601342.1 Appr-1-p processing enzyme family protein [Sinorhizobium phage phiM7]AGR47919.1 Appr-1-p processing enzyme family [Sinorhizobium phage phiM12]AKF12762.1 Appr-1-p processing enzyme family protein [Sinorhizobium phage phiM7]AKF13122.1 Appr-1-p processing enzyme family protein [Sinorhizobium phage phiM19]